MWVVKVIDGLISHKFGLHNEVLVSDGVYPIQDEAQSEGERQKIIQAPLNNANNKAEKPDEEEHINQQPPERSPKPHQKQQSSNSITFLSIQEPQIKFDPELQDKDQPSDN